MKRFLAILFVCLTLCAACAVGVSAATKKFDPEAVTQCMLANDTRGIVGYGHLSIVLLDKNGYGRFYAYRRTGLLKLTFTPSQMQQFLKDGLPFKESLFHYDRIIAFNILPEEGKRMYDHAENTEFKPFYRNASFWSSVWPVKTDNCLTVARSILIAGSRRYAFLYPFGQPNTPFYTMQMRLKLRFIPYTIYLPAGPKPEIPDEIPPAIAT